MIDSRELYVEKCNRLQQVGNTGGRRQHIKIGGGIRRDGANNSRTLFVVVKALFTKSQNKSKQF